MNGLPTGVMDMCSETIGMKDPRTRSRSVRTTSSTYPRGRNIGVDTIQNTICGVLSGNLAHLRELDRLPATMSVERANDAEGMEGKVGGRFRFETTSMPKKGPSIRRVPELP